MTPGDAMDLWFLGNFCWLNREKNLGEFSMKMVLKLCEFLSERMLKGEEWMTECCCSLALPSKKKRGNHG
jgi:hypothetical protein